MDYQILVLDLDGTLTNSKKEITEPTKQALIDIQEKGKKVVLASGRPTPGILPLAKELQLEKYGSYILSFNGAKIIDCRSKKILYNRTIPVETIQPIYEILKNYDMDLLTYTDSHILSGIKTNQFTELESHINKMPIRQTTNFLSEVTFPVNKLLGTGNKKIVAKALETVKSHFHSQLNIYLSEPFFLEIMPQRIDKAHSLQKLLNSIGLTADSMICCGDGYNDLTMIEYAGLGVAMENAQPLVKESADYITKSNDADGILHVINEFMR
ncbi:Cof-type HAD-IIB family hydrolase [Faecalimonas sp.]